MRTTSGPSHRDGGRPPAAGLRHVAVVSSDPGGTNAVVPVVRALLESGARVWVGTSDPAGSAWDRAGLAAPPEHLAEALAAGDAQRILQKQSPDLLLTGAGGFNRIEHTFRLAARSLSLPSVAVLDDRGGYRQRFARRSPEGLEHVVPDRICVPDEGTRREMIGEGYPAAAVCVTGQPHLEAVERFFAGLSPGDLRRRRDAAGLSPEDRVVAFFSENLAEALEGRSPSGRPPQLDSLALLLEALAGLPMGCRRGLRLLVKAHPREDPGPLRLALAGAQETGFRVALAATGDALDLVALSDVAVGITSMVLLEAVLAGRPAISIQIGHPKVPRWWGGLEDRMPVATSLPELWDMLQGALGGAPPPRACPSFRGATEAVLQVMEATVGEAPGPAAASPPVSDPGRRKGG